MSPSRLKLAVVGDLTKAMDAYESRVAEAVTSAVDECLEDSQNELRAQIQSAGLGVKLPRTIQKKRYPRSGASIGAAGIVFTKAPEIVRAFNAGSVIVPKHGAFLAIPTQFNLTSGRWRNAKSKSWAGVRVTPEDMVKSGAAFVIENKDGPGKLWMLTVTRAQTRAQRTNKTTGKITYYKPRDLAYAGGMVPIGGGRRGRVQAAIDAGAVPMFTLLPQVKMTKKLDIARVRANAQRRLPRLMRFNLDKIGDPA